MNTEVTPSKGPREILLVLSSRDFLRAASFALFASISARRRSANAEAADDIVLYKGLWRDERV